MAFQIQTKCRKVVLQATFRHTFGVEAFYWIISQHPGRNAKVNHIRAGNDDGNADSLRIIYHYCIYL